MLQNSLNNLLQAAFKVCIWELSEAWRRKQLAYRQRHLVVR